ncbi:adenylate/guanylate cyclase domain-containing protein [Nitratireductor arenosus]|nr:adenylate/guanylate cyclase domain-containing protein [Nitratireductor arenosus]
MVERPIIDDLNRWMIDGARPSADARIIIDRFCRDLVTAGVPIDRFALFINTLHPNVAGRRFTWTPQAGVDLREGGLGLFVMEEYVNNPLPRVTRTQEPLRRRLTDPASLTEFIILGELASEGFTDYIAHPLIFTTGETHSATFSTKAADGFSDDMLMAVEAVRRPLTRLVEAYLLRLNAASILSAYVGRNSGGQVLAGKVHRGDGEEIEAAILFTDLIGFTALSNRHSGPQIVTLLNDVFDIIVPPVEERGGEILKFLGDGFFAIFPYGGQEELSRAVKAASEAVLDSEEKLAGSTVGKTAGFRSAIHAGRFHYGNIGGANRLDFTAIGRPVNYAARLLSAADALSARRVASAETAQHLCQPSRLAGEMPFKGFEGHQKIFSY